MPGEIRRLTLLGLCLWRSNSPCHRRLHRPGGDHFQVCGSLPPFACSPAKNSRSPAGPESTSWVGVSSFVRQVWWHALRVRRDITLGVRGKGPDRSNYEQKKSECRCVRQAHETFYFEFAREKLSSRCCNVKPSSPGKNTVSNTAKTCWQTNYCRVHCAERVPQRRRAGRPPPLGVLEKSG